MCVKGRNNWFKQKWVRCHTPLTTQNWCQYNAKYIFAVNIYWFCASSQILYDPEQTYIHKSILYQNVNERFFYYTLSTRFNETTRLRHKGDWYHTCQQAVRKCNNEYVGSEKTLLLYSVSIDFIPNGPGCYWKTINYKTKSQVHSSTNIIFLKHSHMTST